jgi:hypothetical protein
MDSESTAMPKMAKALMVGREYRIGMERGREEGVGGKEKDGERRRRNSRFKGVVGNEKC